MSIFLKQVLIIAIYPKIDIAVLPHHTDRKSKSFTLKINLIKKKLGALISLFAISVNILHLEMNIKILHLH